MEKPYGEAPKRWYEGYQYGCGCMEYYNGKIVYCNEHEPKKEASE